LKCLSFTSAHDVLNTELMIVLENVYGNLLPATREEIVNLWKSEHALTDLKRMEERLNQVVFVIRNSETGKLAGVSTAEKKKVEALNNNYLYEFRCFIATANRIAGLDVKLSKETFGFLESLAKTDSVKPVGIFSVLENETLKKEPVWRRAVWPEIEMYFVGYTNTGNPIRVHYFKNVRI
jgi:hypothetical protein